MTQNQIEYDMLERLIEAKDVVSLYNCKKLVKKFRCHIKMMTRLVDLILPSEDGDWILDIIDTKFIIIDVISEAIHLSSKEIIKLINLPYCNLNTFSLYGTPMLLILAQKIDIWFEAFIYAIDIGINIYSSSYIIGDVPGIMYCIISKCKNINIGKEAISYLVYRGYDINRLGRSLLNVYSSYYIPNMHNALHYAIICTKNNHDIYQDFDTCLEYTKHLLELGANPNLTTNKYNIFVLVLAIKHDRYIEQVKLLLEYDVNVNIDPDTTFLIQTYLDKYNDVELNKLMDDYGFERIDGNLDQKMNQPNDR